MLLMLLIMPAIFSDRGLTAKDFTDQRNDAMREGVKALVLMNGGGAVALLAFLQAVWFKAPALVKFILWGIALLVIGVGLAGLVHLFRVHTSNATQWMLNLAQHEPRHVEGVQSALAKARLHQRLYLACAYASLVSFIVGVGVVLVGAAVTPTIPPPSGVEY
jgi:uncharacterized membrane protein YeiB